MKNIERWVDKGLIDENLAQVLRDDIKEQTQKQNRLYFQIILYTIGVILIAAGVITFVSGNDWIIKLFNKIPLLKEILLLIVTVLSFWGGYNLKFIKQKYFKLADALIYLSNLLIGANYALLGQIYNWNSNALVGYLWLLSIIPFAYIFKSNAINRVCLVLFIFSFYSFYDELNLDKIEAWTVIIPLSLSGILYGIANFPKIRDKFSSFSLDYKMTSVFFAFFTLLVLTFSVNPSYNIAHPCYILPAVLYCLMSLYNYFKGSREDKLLSKETIFFILLGIFELSLLCFPVLIGFAVAFCAHIFIIYMIAQGIYWGYYFKNVSLINLINFFLLIYLLCVYTRFGWSYIDKTLFFLIGGFILVGVGMYLEKEKKTRIKGN